jgi:hypothetical protein
VSGATPAAPGTRGTPARPPGRPQPVAAGLLLGNQLREPQRVEVGRPAVGVRTRRREQARASVQPSSSSCAGDRHWRAGADAGRSSGEEPISPSRGRRGAERPGRGPRGQGGGGRSRGPPADPVARSSSGSSVVSVSSTTGWRAASRSPAPRWRRPPRATA